MSVGPPQRSVERQLLAWLDGVQVDGWISPAQSDRVADELAQAGWELWTIGRARSGRPMRALVRRRSGRRIMAYGYPHPDEPIGATALTALARLLTRHTPPCLDDVSFYLVLCADLDAGERNTWIAEPSLGRFLREHYRPAEEVDYRFPIAHRVLEQSRSWAPGGLPLPMPESIALADLIEDVDPDTLGLMHSHHCSGAYTFLSARPTASMVRALDRVATWSGIANHDGHQPDPGRPWLPDRPDLLAEPSLSGHLHRLSERFGPLEGLRVAGTVPVSVFSDNHNERTRVITPEAGIWRAQARPASPPELSTTRLGAGWATWAAAIQPDGQRQRLLVHVSEHAPSPAPEAAAAALSSLTSRAWWLAEADAIWAQASGQLPSAMLVDRAQRRREGAEASARTAARWLRQPPRRADPARTGDFHVRCLFDAGLAIGSDLGLLRQRGPGHAADAAEKLLDRLEHELSGLLAEVEPARAVRSQLARLLLVALGR